MVVGDLADPASFENTLDGIDSVSVNSSAGPVVRAQRNLIDAAKRAAASHIVNLSWIGVSAGEDRLSSAHWHAEVERHLVGSGVPYAILRANTFMQNYLYCLTYANVDALIGTASTGRCSMVDARDVAAVAAGVILDGGRTRKVYDVTGPEALTPAQVAATISKVTGRHMRYIAMSVEELAASYQYGGSSGRLADDLATADELRTEGYLSQVTDVVERMTGRRPVAFEEFVREFARPVT